MNEAANGKSQHLTHTITTASPSDLSDYSRISKNYAYSHKLVYQLVAQSYSSSLLYDQQSCHKDLVIRLMDFAIRGNLICLTFASTSYGRLEQALVLQRIPAASLYLEHIVTITWMEQALCITTHHQYHTITAEV